MQNKTLKRKLRVRNKIKSSNRARLCVSRSNKHIYAQIIEAQTGNVLAAASDQMIDAKKTKEAKAIEVGEQIARLAIKKGVKEVVFDRSGRKYQGRIKALAEGARKAGLQF